MGKPAHVVPKGNEGTGEDVKLSVKDINITMHEAKGMTQKEIAVSFYDGNHKMVRKNQSYLNERSGNRSQGGRVGWAFQHGVLTVNSRKEICSVIGGGQG